MEDFRIGRSFSILHRRSQQFVVSACSKLSLSYPEYILLIAVLDEEGQSQDELAELLFLDKAVVTRTITMLEEKDFVYREQDDKDHRIKRIFPKENAKLKEKFLRDILDKWLNYLFGDLDDKELEEVSQRITKLADRAKRYVIH